MPLAHPFPGAPLAWERAQEARYEFDGVRVFAMNGGSLNHSVISTNLVEALGRRLTRPCRAFRGDVKILTASSVRYPDAVVTCSPWSGRSDIVPNPVVVFEVLSPSTASVDRLVKNAEYRAIPSVRRYVLLEQGRMGATVFAREGGNWMSLILIGDAMLSMPEIGVDIPLSEIYRDVEFPENDPDA